MADLAALRARLRQLDRVVVAFSGGADSAFLAWVAHDTLGRDGAARAVTAVSPSLAPAELEDCASLAREWDLQWSTVRTDELDRPCSGFFVLTQVQCGHGESRERDAPERPTRSRLAAR